MRAVAYNQAGKIDRPDALLDIELPDPIASRWDLLVEVKAISVNPVDVKIRSGSGPIVELIAPQGRFALIDDPATLDISPFKRKSVSVHWELMFTRSIFGTADIAERGRLLAEVARHVDGGELRTTLTERLSPINAANLKHAHVQIESAATRGKVVLERWG